jgi:magnesium transporter
MKITEQIIDEPMQHNQEAFERLLSVSLEHDYFAEAKDLIAEAHIADLAGFLSGATSSQKVKVLGIIDEEKTGELLTELDDSVIPIIVEMIGYEKAAKIIDTLDVDEAIYILDSLEDDLDQVILKFLKGKSKKELKEGLSYPEGSAGRLMQKKFVSVSENWDIGQTIDYIQKRQKQDSLPEIFYEVFITDSKLTPIGSAPLSALVAGSRDLKVIEVMKSEIKSVRTNLDEEEVSYLFKKYGFITVPVVNKANKIVGAITLEDAVDVIENLAEETSMHMGGVREDDVHFDLIEVIKSRFPWLLISLIAATACSLVVTYFQGTIQQVVILSAIMPIVAGISGNAGTQTMTITVLSLSSKELTALNITRVVLKQIISCSLNGAMIAFLGGIILMLLHGNYLLSVVFGIAVTINFALAGFFGSVIPIILNKNGFDPAIASPVFVTTLTDTLSFGIFLVLATKILL